MDVIARTLAAVPDYEAFMTVDELDASSRALAADYPDLVARFKEYFRGARTDSADWPMTSTDGRGERKSSASAE